MSSVFVEPNQFSSQTSPMIRSRRTTRPGLAHEQREQVELLRGQLQLRSPPTPGARRGRRARRPPRRGRAPPGAAGRAPGPAARRGGTAWRGSRRRRVEADDGVHLLVAGGQEQDRHGGRSARTRRQTSRPSRPGSPMSRISRSWPPPSRSPPRPRRRRRPRPRSPPAAAPGPADPRSPRRPLRAAPAPRDDASAAPPRPAPTRSCGQKKRRRSPVSAYRLSSGMS